MALKGAEPGFSKEAMMLSAQESQGGVPTPQLKHCEIPPSPAPQNLKRVLWRSVLFSFSSRPFIAPWSYSGAGGHGSVRGQ